MFNIVGWGWTDVGRIRAHNQDSFLAQAGIGLWVVCDGMGGAAAGDVASRMAVDTLREVVESHEDELALIPTPARRNDRADILRWMEQGVHQACRRVYEESTANVERQGMGTTLTALITAGGRGFVVHVGDSRAYLLRRGQVHLLTEDHTVVRELVKSGRVTQDKAKDLPFQGALSRAVGVQSSVKADRLEFQLCHGDRILLCSDGLHRYLTHSRLVEGLSSAEPAKAPVGFVDFANKCGGQDNVTALVLDVSVSEDAMPGTAPEHYQVRVDALREIPLFAHLSDRELMKFMSAMEEHVHPAGHVLIREGESGDSMYVLVQGSAAVSKEGVKIAVVGRGGHIGEMSLLDEAPRSATVVCTELTKTLVIDRASFHRILRADRDLSNKILWCFLHMLSTRLRVTSDELSGRVMEINRLTSVPDIF